MDTTYTIQFNRSSSFFPFSSVGFQGTLQIEEGLENVLPNPTVPFHRLPPPPFYLLRQLAEQEADALPVVRPPDALRDEVADVDDDHLGVAVGIHGSQRFYPGGLRYGVGDLDFVIFP